MIITLKVSHGPSEYLFLSDAREKTRKHLSLFITELKHLSYSIYTRDAFG